MKVAYVTTYDSSDISAWSGLGYFIRKSLGLSGIEIECIDNLNDRWKILGIKNIIYKNVYSLNYQRSRSPKVLKDYAKQVGRKLLDLDVDIVFSPGTFPISYLDTDIPIVFWADATFAGMVDFYQNYTNLCAETLKNGYEMEQMVFDRCNLAIFASDWAAKSALDNYNVDPVKVKVVPFGANLEITHTQSDVERWITLKATNQCRLLFIGTDWKRKGGDLALRISELLNQKGLETILHIVGTVPPVSLPSHVKVHGYISKNNKVEREMLEGLLKESHFFIMPSQAECFGVVFAEASAFGLPSLSTNVGGIPTAVVDNVNGKLFSLDAKAEDYAAYIFQMMCNYDIYTQLAHSTYNQYLTQLNWKSAGNTVREMMQDILK